jgi:hypothetical protein
MPLNILVIGASGHLLVLGICTYDLLTKSKRKNKPGWFFLVLLVPVIGAFAYQVSKRRKRVSRWM